MFDSYEKLCLLKSLNICSGQILLSGSVFLLIVKQKDETSSPINNRPHSTHRLSKPGQPLLRTMISVVFSKWTDSPRKHTINHIGQCDLGNNPGGVHRLNLQRDLHRVEDKGTWDRWLLQQLWCRHRVLPSLSVLLRLRLWWEMDLVEVTRNILSPVKVMILTAIRHL